MVGAGDLTACPKCRRSDHLHELKASITACQRSLDQVIYETYYIKWGKTFGHIVRTFQSYGSSLLRIDPNLKNKFLTGSPLTFSEMDRKIRFSGKTTFMFEKDKFRTEPRQL